MFVVVIVQACASSDIVAPGGNSTSEDPEELVPSGKLLFSFSIFLAFAALKLEPKPLTKPQIVADA